MQAISSFLSSTVFLRTSAGFPFPHFGRLRTELLRPGRKNSKSDSKLFLRAKWGTVPQQELCVVCGTAPTWSCLARCCWMTCSTQTHICGGAPVACWDLAPSPAPRKSHWTNLQQQDARKVFQSQLARPMCAQAFPLIMLLFYFNEHMPLCHFRSLSKD